MGTVNFEREAVLPTGGDLADHEIAVGTRIELDEHRGVVVGVDRLVFVVLRCEQLAGKRFDIALRLLANVVYRDEVRAYTCDRLPRDELHQVAPMRADVGNGAACSAVFGNQPPVPIGILVEPVLQVRSMGRINRADVVV